MTPPHPTLLRRLRAAGAALLFVLALAATAQAQQVHVVERGDTLFSLARTYGTTVFEIRQANNLLSNQITVGQRLRIPTAAQAPPAPPPPSPLASTPPVPAEPDATGALVHTVRAGETLYRLSVWYDASVAELMAWNGMTSTTLSVGQRVVVRPRDALAATPPALDTTEPDAADEVAVSVPTPPSPSPPSAGADEPSTDEPSTDAPAADETDEPESTTREASDEVAAVRPGGVPGDADVADETDFADEDAEGEPAPPRTATPPTPAAPPPPRSLLPAEAVRLAAAPPPFEITDTTVPADEVHIVRRGETLYAVAARYQVATQALADANPGLTTAPLVAGQLLHLPEEVGSMQYHRTVQAPLPPPDETGQVLVYPDGLTGQAMASGVAYDPDALVASHRDLPFGTIVLVTNPALQRSVFVRIADRGPVSEQFMMELSGRAAEALGLNPDQTASVDLRLVP